jgi:hypothetical protein
MDDLTKGTADFVINHLFAEIEFFTVENPQCTLNLGENSGLPDRLGDGLCGVVRSAIRNRLDQVFGKLFWIVNRPEGLGQDGRVSGKQ